MVDSPILQAIGRAKDAYYWMTQKGELLPFFTFDDETQLFRWADTATARYVYLKSNGEFNHAEGIPANGKN